MSISFSGLASGLDTASWVDALVSAKQSKVKDLQVQLATMKSKKSTINDTRSAVTSLRNALEKLTDTKFGGNFDLFGRSKATSSNTSVFTATASADALKQSYDITVQQLATYTKAASVEPASAIADDETKLSNIGITSGKITTYVNGRKTEIEVDEESTLKDLKDKLDEAGIAANVDESGVLTLSAKNPGDTINIGSTTDTSNFVSFVGLSQQEDGTYLSSNSLFKASIASKLTSEDSGFKEQITAGTFTIGNAEFTINEKTTLSSLISAINNNSEAQAYAYWDDTTGKLNITSTKEGASYINIEAGTSNFTDVMGLTQTVRDGEGNPVSSKMFTEAQELGLNSKFTINGTEMTAASNTISADISRIKGVTITLNKVSTEEDGHSTLKIESDTSGVVDAVKSFISAYNKTIAKIDEVTSNGSDLQRDSSLTSLKRTLMNYANGSNIANGGAFKLLSEVGISTAKADGNDLSTNTYALELDEDKLLKAIEEDPESVQALLTGNNGILGMMENSVEQTLSSTGGYFNIQTTTLDSNIKRMEEKINKQNTKINTYKTQLEKKFKNMETMIAKMQQNYSSFM